MQPVEEQYEDADAPQAHAHTAITRLIITVMEPESPQPIGTVPGGWLVSDRDLHQALRVGELEAATRQLPTETGDGSQAQF
jgi:hypothetical protein